MLFYKVLLLFWGCTRTCSHAWWFENVMFSGTVPDYLFIYVFLLFPEVQKCYVFRHCVRLFVYLCISIISRSPEMLCFQALCQIICLFLLFPEVQKCYVFWHCVRLFVYFMYFYYFQKSRNVMFSGTEPDYLFICVFLLFPEVQKCYVFWHCVRLFVYFMYFYYFQKSRNVMFSGTVSDYLFILCISIIFRSPEMLCFLALCQIICLFYVFLLFPEVQKCYVFWH